MEFCCVVYRTNSGMSNERKRAAEEHPTFLSVERDYAYVLPKAERIRVAIQENDKIRKAADKMMKALATMKLDDEESCKMVVGVARDWLIVDQWGFKEGHHDHMFAEMYEKPRIVQGSEGRRVGRRKVARKQRSGQVIEE